MTEPNPALVSMQNVSMTFEQQNVLANISLDIAAGQTVVLIGESGCGKTVLLKLIVALLKPTRGRVLFDGKVLADLGDSELARERRRFGFLFQGAALFDSMSVFDNVAFGLRGQPGITEQDIAKQVRQRLAEVGLTGEVEQKKPAELSGGMKKRVGLARAMSLNPEVMLYDEPTTGLDPIMSDVINDLILQTRQRHPVTSIVVTHDMNTVRKVAERVVMLYPLARLEPGQSQIIFDDPPEQLMASTDERVRQFVGTR